VEKQEQRRNTASEQHLPPETHPPLPPASTFPPFAGVSTSNWPDLPPDWLDEETELEETTRTLEHLQRLEQEQRGI
jgi:hypothetical protein